MNIVGRTYERCKGGGSTERHTLRVSHILPPPLFGSWVFTPFEAWCFCHMDVHGDSNSSQDGRNSYHDGQIPKDGPMMEGQEFVLACPSNEQTLMFGRANSAGPRMRTTPHPPQGASGQQVAAKGTGLRSLWAPKAPDGPQGKGWCDLGRIQTFASGGSHPTPPPRGGGVCGLWVGGSATLMGLTQQLGRGRD